MKSNKKWSGEREEGGVIFRDGAVGCFFVLTPEKTGPFLSLWS